MNPYVSSLIAAVPPTFILLIGCVYVYFELKTIHRQLQSRMDALLIAARENGRQDERSLRPKKCEPNI
jgi:hypothetical protein